MRLRAVCVLFALSGLWPGATFAGNSDEILLGNEAALTGGAVTATTATGSALWYNPAGLAAADLQAIDVSANAFTVRWVSIAQFLATSANDAASGDFTEFLAIPSALTYVRRVSRTVSLGFGIFVPHYNDVDLRALLQASGPNARQWLYALVDSLKRYHFAGGAGWQVTPRLHLGGSFAFIYETDARSLNFTGTAGSETDTDFLTVTSLYRRQSFGFEFRFGLKWLVSDHWRIGAAVATPGVFVANNVSEVDTVAQAFDDGTPGGNRTASILTNDGVDYGVEMLHPARIRLGVAYQARKFDVSLDGDIQPGLSNEALSFEHVPTWNVRVGGRYAFTDRVSAGLGLFTDRGSGVAGASDGLDFYGFAGGVHYTTVKRLAANEKQDRIFFSTTLGMRYAFGYGTAQGLLIPEDLSPETDLDIRAVSASVNEFTVHLGSALYF